MLNDGRSFLRLERFERLELLEQVQNVQMVQYDQGIGTKELRNVL